MTASASLAALALSGCSTVPTPEETVEQLEEVIHDDPTPPADEGPEAEPIVVDELDCAPLLLITARGTGEPSSRQLLTPVVKTVKRELKKQDGADKPLVSDLAYPASGEINVSAVHGMAVLTETLEQQHSICPDQQFVLMGYSQGALVISETLTAPEQRLIGADLSPLSEAAADSITAVVLYADPRFVGSDPFGAGDYDPEDSGLLARSPGALDTFAERAQSFCVADDFICQAHAPINDEGHVAYYSNGMQQDGAAFVIDRVGAVVVTPPEGDSAVTRSPQGQRSVR